MLSPKAQYNVGDAKKYFREHLCAGDYYTEGQHVPGHWFGQAAADLGLSGVTTEEQFARLCDNLHPRTGERLITKGLERIEARRESVALSESGIAPNILSIRG